MHVGRWALLIMMALAGAAAAQPTAEGPASRCDSQASVIARDMELARSKGQMLRYRQLADQRAALLQNCPSSSFSPDESRADRVKRLEQTISQLRRELGDAEAELERLRRVP